MRTVGDPVKLNAGKFREDKRKVLLCTTHSQAMELAPIAGNGGHQGEWL